jgi:hypothetical protein
MTEMTRSSLPLTLHLTFPNLKQSPGCPIHRALAMGEKQSRHPAFAVVFAVAVVFAIAVVFAVAVVFAIAVVLLLLFSCHPSPKAEDLLLSLPYSSPSF